VLVVVLLAMVVAVIWSACLLLFMSVCLLFEMLRFAGFVSFLLCRCVSTRHVHPWQAFRHM
jgi:hypothetical protein